MDFEHGAWQGSLEVRQDGRDGMTLHGHFPYGRTATIANRGRRRKERLNRGSFQYQIDRHLKARQSLKDAEQELAAARTDAQKRAARAALSDARQELERSDIHVLVGHDFNRVLGSMARRTAQVDGNMGGVSFAVDLPSERDMPSYMLDMVKSIRAGLVGGISPGFIIPPRDVVPNAETEEEEAGNPGVFVRVINAAVLYEMSLVTRPAYTETNLDLRSFLLADVDARSARPRARTIFL